MRQDELKWMEAVAGPRGAANLPERAVGAVESLVCELTIAEGKELFRRVMAMAAVHSEELWAGALRYP